MAGQNAGDFAVWRFNYRKLQGTEASLTAEAEKKRLAEQARKRAAELKAQGNEDKRRWHAKIAFRNAKLAADESPVKMVAGITGPRAKIDIEDAKRVHNGRRARLISFTPNGQKVKVVVDFERVEE